ncbi:FGGY-family carbohydrate kinase [Hominiventricola aquisgranensis]|uniref:FGGY-family carbohydrate kinase n=1 Tax=Hominiventricola aquisgranensis TaxID=3133164 RepID=A0ABV1I3D7_9FIRM
MFCGLDLGTSGVKAAVFDEKGKQMAFARRECDLIFPHTGWAELNARDYWNKIREVLREVSAKMNGNIQAISISSQAQAVVPITREGQPLYNIIVTMDNRTLKQYRFWKDNFDEWEMYQKTGNAFSTIYTLNKIMWHKENLPQVYEDAWKFCCVPDYAGYLLTGENPLIDYSVAGRSMMLSPDTLIWNEEVLELAEISKEKLSTPVSSTTILGKVKKEVCRECQLSEDCVVVVGGHDQACGAVGSGVCRAGMLMDACGTVDAMLTVLPKLEINRKMLKNNLPCYRHVTDSNYITMAINTNGGLFFKWYKKTFYSCEAGICEKEGRDIYTEIIEQCSDKPSDMYILPHIEGAGTPYNDPQSLGAVIGLKANYTKKDISRAVLDSLAYEMKINLLALEESTEQPVEEIRLIGGGAKTARWLQIKADVFGKKITTLQTNEAASLGAAIIAAVGTAYYKTIEEATACMVHSKDTFFPNLDMYRQYSDRFEEYKSIYGVLKPLNHRISNRLNL